MTAKEMADLIGAYGTVRAGAFNVRVTVMDVKSVYGGTRYLVKPLEGSGEAWVTDATFNLDKA